jgi:phosphotransferase system enzyme I (PtsI)
MHPAQLLSVKQEILRADSAKVQPWAQEVLADDEPGYRLGPNQNSD